MDPNSQPDINLITAQQLFDMQQRLQQLEHFTSQQAQPSAEPQSHATPPVVTPMMDDEEAIVSALHSLEVRPSFSWTPSNFLQELLSLDSSLFSSPLLTDEQRRKTIEKYPNIDNVQYQPPDTIPMAARKMNKYQNKQDMSLKRIQYLLSGVFRPLDVLGLEISKEVDNANVQRYLHMLRDCRSLLLNVSAQVNELRNTIAFQAINPHFTSTSSSTTNFTMSPEAFQTALVQQTTTAQALKNAGNQRNKKRNFSNQNLQQQHVQPQQFFRSGPSSGQGGFTPFWNNNNSQQMFIKWALKHQVSLTSFTAVDLINFLSDMHTIHSYSVSTLQLFRSAVTHLNDNANDIRDNEDLNSFIGTLLHKAPPIRLHRQTISLEPTFEYLRTLDVNNISLAKLQNKLAFLLGVTCFLRPSDLHRIPLSSVKLSNNSTLLSFDVSCPKEKRARRSIIKSFEVQAHSNPSLCPVTTYIAHMRKRPSCSSTTLFVNALEPNKPLSARTIQRWIRNLLQISTKEEKVSLRSIASSMALQAGIPKDDIVTMGNWSSSTTFENHYRREHLSNFDFTNTLITTTDKDEDYDVFFDAEDTVSDFLDEGYN